MVNLRRHLEMDNLMLKELSVTRVPAMTRVSAMSTIPAMEKRRYFGLFSLCQ